MKTVTREDSVECIAERRGRVAQRHGQAGHWSPQGVPVFGQGKACYTVAGPGDVTPVGGLGALYRLVVKLGLPGKIDSRLSLLKVHLPYSESDHVLNLAYNVAAGGTGWRTSRSCATMWD